MELHIAYACNTCYMEQTIVSMVSLLEHNRTQQIVLYFIADHVKPFWIEMARRTAAAYGARLKVVSLDRLLGELKQVLSLQNSRHPLTIYAKLFLDRICGADRILYLDSDTVILDSLLPLWDMEFKNAWAAGVAMPYSDIQKRRLGLDPADTYVCDGILMLHLKQWREQCCGQRCVDYIYAKKGRPPMLSEGVVNFICRKRLLVLHPRYNLMSGMLLWDAAQLMRLYGVQGGYYANREILQARYRPVIVHYLNELYLRPWYAGSGHPYRLAYRYYRKKAGLQSRLPYGRLKTRTYVLRIMNACLPFPVFCGIYRKIKSIEQKRRGQFINRDIMDRCRI